MRWKNKGHELDAIGAKLKERKKLIFVGVSERMADIWERVAFLGCSITVCDDKFQGQELKNLVIVPVKSLFEKGQKDALIILTETDNCESKIMLKKKLIFSGFCENEDFFEADVFQRIYLPIWTLYAFDKCYVEHICHGESYACTLKCKKCSAGIPYLKLKNPTNEQIKEEIDLFFSKVDFVHTYDCTSGETFLVSDKLAENLTYLLNNYRNRIGEIIMVSNATVIPSENLLRLLQEMKRVIPFTITVSCYENLPGWKEKFAQFTQVMNEWDIPFTLVPIGAWIDFGFDTTNRDGSDDEMETWFDQCGDFCRSYVDGKEYYCGHGHSSTLIYYPEKDDTEECLDYRDDQVTPTIITEWHLGFQPKGYLEICRHCNGWGKTNEHFIPVAEQLEGGTK